MVPGSPGVTNDDELGGWGPPLPPPPPLIPPDRAARGRPGRRGRRRRGGSRALKLALLGIAALIAAGVVAVALTHHGNPRTRPAPAARSSPATTVAPRTGPAPSPAAAASAIGSAIATSAAGRSQVITAIDGIQACSVSPAQGASVVRAVVASRRQALGQLERIDTSQLAGGSTLVSDLTTAINASISADESYVSWMGDVGSGAATCAGNPMDDPNFSAAQAESAKANQDKAAFAREWNPVAARFGLTTYEPAGF